MMEPAENGATVVHSSQSHQIIVETVLGIGKIAMNTLIGFRRDRLGGRLANLVYTWRLAKKLGCRAVIYWPKPVQGMEDFYGEGYEVGNFIDLLQTYSRNNDNDLIIIDREPDDVSQYPSLLTDTFLLERNVGGIDKDAFFTKSNIVLYTGYALVRMKDEDRGAAKREATDLLAQLAPTTQILAAFARLQKECKPRAMVAVHYRRGDITHYLREQFRNTNDIEKNNRSISKFTAFWFRKCAPFQSYISYVNDHVRSDLKIAIFSDEKGAADQFISALGANRVYSAQAFEETMLPIQFVSLEMMFMANCRSIVSTKSGFSEIPALMGGKSIINIQKYCTLDQISDDYVEVTGLDRLSKVPDSILNLFGKQGAQHYRKMFKSIWSETDFNEALLESWQRKRNEG